MRLINADAFYKDICDSINEMTRIGIAVDGEWLWGKLNDSLENAPTIEPEPQRTGRWIDHVKDGYVECPFCHSATNCDDNISDLHFCFSCGARMEGE